ncbi:MAG: hypothetical protein EOP34_11555, partial [Rickettsiales bacterium]
KIITKFVESYNEIKKFVTDQNKRDIMTGKYTEEAILGGDQLLRNINRIIDDEMIRSVKGIINSDNNIHPSTLAEIGIKYVPTESTDTGAVITDYSLYVDNTQLSKMLVSNFEDVKNIFGFTSYSSNNDFYIYKTSSKFNVNEFSIDLDLSRQQGRQAIIKYNNNNNQINIETAFKNNIISISNEGALVDNKLVNTMLNGLEVAYIGKSSSATTDISFSQGIADRLYDITNNMIAPGKSIIDKSIDSVKSNTSSKKEQINKLEEQLKETKDKLLKKMAAVEESISKVNSIIQMIEANDYAKRAK